MRVEKTILLTSKQSVMLHGHLLPQKTGKTIKLWELSSLPDSAIDFPSCVSLMCCPLEKVRSLFRRFEAKSVFKKCTWLSGGKEVYNLIIGGIDYSRVQHWADVVALLRFVWKWVCISRERCSSWEERYFVLCCASSLCGNAQSAR